MLTRSENHNPNYLAKIIRISNLTPIEGADKIQIANVDFQSVVVSKDVKEGDIMVYFPVESQIDSGFLSHFNSFRNKELNKNPQKSGGFFDDKGRVKALRLFKGTVKSNGYLAPIDQIMEYFGKFDVKSNINETFDTINGKLLLKKFRLETSNKTKTKIGKKPKISRLIDGQVHLHVDTEKLEPNLWKINPFHTIAITYKTHGCLPSFQKVKMWDGSSKPISKIKPGEVVLGYDEEKNIFLPSKVLNTFINGRTDTWVSIKKSNIIKKLGSYQNKLYCTPNHRVLTEGGYKMAQDLKRGDKVFTFYNEFNISNDHQSILTGKLLGDGCINRSNGIWHIGYSHKKEHEAYVMYCSNLLGNLSTGRFSELKSGYGTEMIRTSTKACKSITNKFTGWYLNGKKVIPKDLTLDPISMAFWYMDDGSLIHTDYQKDRARFAVCGFSDEDCKIIIKAMLSYGFKEPKLFKDKEGYNRIRLNKKDADKLFNDIYPYVPEVMEYKLPKEFRGSSKIIELNQSTSITVSYEEEVVDIRNNITPQDLRGASLKYDIETETHNFVSGGIVVHNSSGWISNVKVKRPLKWYEKLLKNLGVKINDEEYDYVYGSRRVVKNESLEDPKRKNHFYESDLWKYVIDTQELKEKTPKGFTLYYEILGYTPEGSYIQKDYDYGCKKGEHRIEVYRITQTNEDGFVTELSYDEIKQFCSKANLTPSHEFHYGKAYWVIPEVDVNNPEWSKLFIEQLRKEYNEKNCFMCSNPVPEEGIVLRVDDLFEYAAFKLKSFRFLERETVQLDKGEENIEDNA